MTVIATHAKDSPGYRFHCCSKRSGDLQWLTTTGVEDRQARIRRFFALFSGFDFEVPINSSKQATRFESGPFASLSVAWPVLGDKQLASAARPEHFDSHKYWRYDHRVETVDSDCVYGVKVSQWLPLIAGERHVASDLFDRAAGLHTPDHVPPRQMLVFETHVGLGENANLG